MLFLTVMACAALAAALWSGAGEGRVGWDETLVVPAPLVGVLGPVADGSSLGGLLGEIDAAVAAFERRRGARGAGAVVVLVVVDSPGGMLAATPGLSDVMAGPLRERGEVVSHVAEALSAAALAAMTAERLTFEPDGVLGAAVTVEVDPLTGAGRELSPREERVALRVGEIVAERGGHSRQVMLALQAPTGLSIGLAGNGRDGGGEMILANDASLERVVARPGELLTLNAETARELGLSVGSVGIDALLVGEDGARAAAQRRELARALGVEAVRVDLRAWRAGIAEAERRERALEAASEAVRRLAAAMRSVRGGEMEAAGPARRALADLRAIAAENGRLAAYFDLSDERLAGYEAEIERLAGEGDGAGAGASGAGEEERR